MKHVLLAGLAIAGAVTMAAAQTRPAAETIRMRQANYKQMGGAVKGIFDQLASFRSSHARDPAPLGDARAPRP